jgi:hypothetical protein
LAKEVCMKREDVDKREKDLCDLLKSLSSTDLDVNKNEIYTSIITSLHAVYDLDNEKDNVYRHSYSQIFILLSKLHTEQTLQNSLDSLIQNLRFVYYKVQKDSKENSAFRKAIYKLYDHVNLDIARIVFFEKENTGYYSKVIHNYTVLKNDVNKANNDFQKTASDLKISQEKSKIDECGAESPKNALAKISKFQTHRQFFKIYTHRYKNIRFFL